MKQKITPAQQQVLIQMYNSGAKIEEMREAIGFSCEDIADKLNQLGYPYKWGN